MQIHRLPVIVRMIMRVGGPVVMIMPVGMLMPVGVLMPVGMGMVVMMGMLSGAMPLMGLRALLRAAHERLHLVSVYDAAATVFTHVN